MWEARSSAVLDLCLRDDSKVEKEEVYYTGSHEKPHHFSGDCYRVRFRFKHC